MKKILIALILVSSLQVAPVQVEAQCPMCRIAAESDLRAGGKQGRGLNTGILYLFAMPYLIIGTIGLVWLKNRKKVEEDYS